MTLWHPNRILKRSEPGFSSFLLDPPCYQYPIDTLPIHIDDFQIETVPLGPVAYRRNMA
jgi:hypothetical protein